LSRHHGATTIHTVDAIEELVLVADGVVWTEPGVVWAALDDDEAPRTIAELTDPHGLATDGTTVFWLGEPDNGAFDTASETRSRIPPIGPPPQQNALAWSEALFGRSDPDGFWRYEGIHVERIPVRLDPAIRLRAGFAAGGDRVFVPALELKAGTVVHWILRIDRRGTTTRVATTVAPTGGRWAVSAGGELAFQADRSGTVARLPTGAKAARTDFVRPGLERLCWCGATLCTLAEGTLRRHPRRGAPVDLQGGIDGATHLACRGDRVAWARPLGARALIRVLPLDR
jgi:hypothetical protein